MFKATEKIISPVYMVGGCVRDLLLNKEPNDYDFCTPLAPFATEEKIRTAGRRPYTVGNRFGTVGVKVPVDGKYHYIEITTFRNEKYQDGSRKPTVEYVTSLAEDLSRRDFTVNAMAMDSAGNITDLFNGREDLDNRLIRCVGEPKHRFKEDPLRMMRAPRLASQHDFKIDKSIYEAVEEMNHKILEVSKERWMLEIDKLLLSDHPRIGLEFMWETKLMNYMFPEMAIQYNFDQENPHHKYPLHEHTIRVVENTIQDTYIRRGAFLHDARKWVVKQYKENPHRAVYYKHELLGAEYVDQVGKYLKWSSDEINIISDMVLNHMKEDSPLYDADTKAK